MLPAGFSHTRDFSVQSKIPEANPANAELTVEAARTPADAAPIVLTYFELGRPFRLNNHC